jgi:hypothetical protein
MGCSGEQAASSTTACWQAVDPHAAAADDDRLARDRRLVKRALHRLTPYAAGGDRPSLLRAAAGRRAVYAFAGYFPLSLHGVLSGALIVYILSIGFFITPALMGGQHDIMIAMLIDRSLEVAVDWPSAALMSLTLLLVTLALYAVYYRVTDIRRLIGAR